MEKIDCFLIGHNEMNFETYEKSIRQTGTNSGAYRDLNLNFIRYNDTPYHASEIVNLFRGSEKIPDRPFKPLNMLESFSATVSYLGSYLHNRDITFDYVHSFQDEKKELSEKMMRENILTIAITTTYYVSVFPILEIMNFVRKYNRTARIIIGGPFISTQVRSQSPNSLEFLFNAIDADFYVNSTQGEAALVKIINALKNGLPFDGIDNLYYKSGGGYISTPVVQESNKLSENMVNWDLFADRVGDFVNVRTAISCPFSCAFCGVPEHAGAYQTAGVEVIEKELNRLDKIESLESVHFIEDTFNVPKDRFKKILRMMIKNKYKFNWHSYFRCQFADRETVELMKESGCEAVYLGLESGDDQILENMNKATTVEKYLEGISLLKEYEIPMHGNFIIGFPGETDDTVRNTKTFIEESGIDFFRVQLWYCMPITPIWKQKDKFNIRGKSFEWSHGTMDSKTACDLIDQMFLTIDTPIWVPQYNFDINSLVHLMYRGMGLDQVKDFLRSFNNGIREKLRNPYQSEVSAGTLERIKNACLDVNYEEK